MKDFEFYKNEVAVKHGFENWNQIIKCPHEEMVIPLIDEAAELYAKNLAIEMCKQQREICADKALLEIKGLFSKEKTNPPKFTSALDTKVTPCKQSILTASLPEALK